MTLLKHEPSAQIPWQNTMLGFAELLTFETSSAFAAVANSPKNEAPTNAALVDRNEERLTLLRVSFMDQDCAEPTPAATHKRICTGICPDCRCRERASIPYCGFRVTSSAREGQ